MLLPNDLLQYGAPRDCTERVLWIDAQRQYAYLFDVTCGSAEVRKAPLPALHEDIEAGRARRLQSDPYLVVVREEQLPAKHLALRDRAWQIIAALTLEQPAVYEPRKRGQLIARYTAAYGVSHPTIYRYLRRYWQRGQTPNALLPDYGNSGARGKVRGSSAGVKRGRPRKDGSVAGLNADEEIRRVFRVASAQYAASHARFSRRGAYRQMIADFFSGRRSDAASGRVLAPAAGAALALPSFGQFNYWLDQDDDRPAQLDSSRMPAPRFTAAAPSGALSGQPGAAFHLEVVQLELQAVSRADRQQLLGRPLLYLAIDEFSRMVTGFYLSLQPLTWSDALLALANCGADKQRFAAQHGCLITAAQWPCQHLPQSLLVAPALLHDCDGGALHNNFGLRCLPSPGAPAEWREALGRRFGLLAPGAAGQPGRLDGVLDLAQLQHLVLEAVLYFNGRHQLAGAAGATPCELWQWGLATAALPLKSCSEQLLRLSLLPQVSATVTAEGIVLNGCYYTCARAIEQRWFERARQRGQWPVRLAYDPADADCVYLLDAGAALQFHTCHMVVRRSAQRNLSVAELAALAPPASVATLAAPAAPAASATPAAPTLRAPARQHAVLSLNLAS